MTLQSDPVLVVRGLSKSYGALVAVDDIGFEIRPGEIVGLVGPNGAGKTTTINMILGVLAPSAGEIRIDGLDLARRRTQALARTNFAATYAPLPGNLTVEQNLLAILETMGLDGATRRARLRELLAELNLTPLARAAAHTLSGGERRRAEITRALVISPKFILLDEPFAGIDPIAVADIQKIIFHLKARGIGVLVTDHNVRETLRIVDRAYIVHGGVIFKSGTPDSLAADEEVRRIYLGTEFRLD